MPEDVQMVLYRVAQEALNNIAKHAHACQVTVQLRATTDRVELRIHDDGVGFDHYEKTKSSSGLGLRNLLNRAEMIGGKMFVESGKNKGTRYTFEVPV